MLVVCGLVCVFFFEERREQERKGKERMSVIVPLVGIVGMSYVVVINCIK